MAPTRMTAPDARQDRRPRIAVGRTELAIEDVIALATGAAAAALDPDPAYRARLAASQRAVARRLAEGGEIYGVTTGVGASVANRIPERLRAQLPHNLIRLHGCGTGRLLDETEAAAVVALRLVSLARGHSGVREVVLERLAAMLNARLLPRIPAEGSGGASGDLTPPSYWAAALVGERETTLHGRVLPAADALAELGLAPLELGPKESLALMNGTSVMTALACLAFERARRLARLACALTAVVVDVTHGNAAHFDARIFDWKPHPGQRRAGGWIRADLEVDAGTPGPTAARLQDRYSLRCAPHVIGVLLDALDFARRVLEVEINGVDDNPLVDPERDEILHGGNFYGGHVCFVLDGLKTAVANVADLLDRQLTLLCDPATSDGLPENLIAGRPPEAWVHHGFKAMQISASALTAEALKLTVPASVFSRSTESHNQDKVSLGTIAARDCLRVLELAETVAAIALLAACQAVDLRDEPGLRRRSRALRDAVRKAIPRLDADRRQDVDIARLLELYRSGALPLGERDVA